MAGTPYSAAIGGGSDRPGGTALLPALEALALGWTSGSSVAGTPLFDADAQPLAPSVALDRPSSAATAVRPMEPSAARRAAPQ